MTERTLPSIPEASTAETAATAPEAATANAAASACTPATAKLPRLEPTRYGDWELYGKCVDF